MRKKLKAALKSFLNINVRLWAVMLACLIFFGGAWGLSYARQISRFGGRENFDQAKRYMEVARVLQNTYIGESDSDKMASAAFAAMVKSLGDPWSYYMTADGYESYQLYSANKYEGIGVTVSKDDKTGGFAVVSVTAGSPAESAGILPGDVILAIDGEDVSGLMAADMRTLIRQRTDESVTLTLKTPDGTKDVEVDCSIIYSNPVDYEMMSRNVGYIRIKNFESGAGTEACAAVDDLLAQGASYFVFDVRGNPGGLLSELILILDHLLPEGEIFVSVDKAGNEDVTYSDNVCVKAPMAVLVDGGTFSAAEFFAAVLSEYGWADIVGEQTSGKSRSQINVELEKGDAIHISSKSYLTPNRVDLSAVGGLIPDYVVEFNKDAKTDNQLEAAINVVLS